MCVQAQCDIGSVDREGQAQSDKQLLSLYIAPEHHGTVGLEGLHLQQATPSTAPPDAPGPASSDASSPSSTEAPYSSH